MKILYVFREHGFNWCQLFREIKTFIQLQDCRIKMIKSDKDISSDTKYFWCKKKHFL